MLRVELCPEHFHLRALPIAFPEKSPDKLDAVNSSISFSFFGFWVLISSYHFMGIISVPIWQSW